jgi:hypothetical protein
MDPKLETALDRTSQFIQVLPSGYGYVDLQRLQVGDVNKMFDTIKNTPGRDFRHAWLSEWHSLADCAAFDRKEECRRCLVLAPIPRSFNFV